MKRHTQEILYHLLPALFWALAIGGSLTTYFILPSLQGGDGGRLFLFGYLVTALVLFCIVIVGRIRRHTDSVEECFQVAVLLGIASYWLPTVLFLIPVFWGYLIYHNLFSSRSLLSTFLGLAFVAVWTAILYYWPLVFPHSTFHFPLPWAEFFAPKNAWGWIPTGAILIAWLASTIVRRILRVR